MRYLSKFALIIVLVPIAAALAVTSAVNAGADDRVTEAAVPSETPGYWLGYRVMRRITPDDPPDAIDRDQHGMHDTIWAYELVSAYESEEITQEILVATFWRERPAEMSALVDFYRSSEITDRFLQGMVLVFNNGINGIVNGRPVFFDVTRYFSESGHVDARHRVDYEASVVANAILEQTYWSMAGDPEPQPNGWCCCFDPLDSCYPKTGTYCEVIGLNCASGSHLCTKNDGSGCPF